MVLDFRWPELACAWGRTVGQCTRYRKEDLPNLWHKGHVRTGFLVEPLLQGPHQWWLIAVKLHLNDILELAKLMQQGIHDGVCDVL